MSSLHVICGLGNPGPDYDRTRHNAGFHVADVLQERHGGRWTFPDPAYAMARATIRGHDALLVKPQTWMNLSGDALRALRASEEFDLSRLIVICDDIYLSEGTLRVRRKGSDGGHNGLASVIDALGTRSFGRLRIGVGAPAPGVDSADYVLEEMGEETAAALSRAVRQAAACVEVWVENGIGVAMNRFNQREKTPPEAPPERD